MDWSSFQNWLGTAPILTIGATLFGSMCLAAVLGTVSRIWHAKRFGPAPEKTDQEAYIVSAVLGLLALLLGFTFSLAADRFDLRRLLVIQEANAIETAYLRAQLLGEPHRTRMSELLVRYTDTRLAFAQAKPTRVRELLAVNDALIVEMWAASRAAFESVKGLDFSSTFIDGMSQIVELDASRKAARFARVPAGIFVVLFVALIASAAVLGFVMSNFGGRIAAGLLLLLFTLVLMLIIDIDRPTRGTIVEAQGPMEELRKTLATWPPSKFDHWRLASP